MLRKYEIMTAGWNLILLTSIYDLCLFLDYIYNNFYIIVFYLNSD